MSGIGCLPCGCECRFYCNIWCAAPYVFLRAYPPYSLHSIVITVIFQLVIYSARADSTTFAQRTLRLGEKDFRLCGFTRA